MSPIPSTFPLSLNPAISSPRVGHRLSPGGTLGPISIAWFDYFLPGPLESSFMDFHAELNEANSSPAWRHSYASSRSLNIDA